MWIMGTRFLQQFHQIYDYEHKRVALELKSDISVLVEDDNAE